MGIKDVSSTGLTIVYTGYSDDMSNKSISYGPDYSLFMKDGDHWVQAPMYAESVFNSMIEGYIIEGESEQKIDWEWLYGSLEPGTYCIEKSLCNQGKHVYISKEDIFQLGVEFIIE